MGPNINTGLLWHTCNAKRRHLVVPHVAALTNTHANLLTFGPLTHLTDRQQQNRSVKTVLRPPDVTSVQYFCFFFSQWHCFCFCHLPLKLFDLQHFSKHLFVSCFAAEKSSAGSVSRV